MYSFYCQHVTISIFDILFITIIYHIQNDIIHPTLLFIEFPYHYFNYIYSFIYLL